MVKKLLNLFDELIEAIFNNKSVSKIDDNVSKNENESEDKIDDNVSANKIDDNVDTNNYFNIIDKTKSFEDQIGILKKMHNLSQYWDMN